MTKNNSNDKHKEEVDSLTYEEYLEKHEYMNKHMLQKKKSNKIIFLLLFVVLLSIVLIGLGFYYSQAVNLRYTNGDLFIVHSKTDFGDIINNFSGYTDENNAFIYTFYVENKNSYDLWYKVVIKDNYDNKLNLVKAEKSNINYAIEKNGSIIFRGYLNQQSEIVLSNSKLLSENVDNYKIKFWSSNGVDGYYKFKIFVEI